MRDGVRPSRDCPQKRARYTESHMEVRRPRVAATPQHPHRRPTPEREAGGKQCNAGLAHLRQPGDQRVGGTAPKGPTEARQGATPRTHKRAEQAHTHTQPNTRTKVTHGETRLACPPRAGSLGVHKTHTQPGEPDRMINTQGGLSDLRWLRDGRDGGGGQQQHGHKEWSSHSEQQAHKIAGTTHSGGHPSQQS